MHDTELTWFAQIGRELYTPVVGDILDSLGHRHQFLPPAIRPVVSSMKVIGRAMPVLTANVYGPQARPFGLLTEALDQLQPGEVYLSAGASAACSQWGEILTATARVRGATGAVIDGFHRDTPKVLEQNFPVFSRGAYAQDAGVRSAVMAFRLTLEVEGVQVAPGDLVFGDGDGVLIVPREIEAEVIEKAFAKARGENLVRREIEAGLSATEAFRKYGIL